MNLIKAEAYSNAYSGLFDLQLENQGKLLGKARKFDIFFRVIFDYECQRFVVKEDTGH